jgi:hypothetical protein
MLYGYWGALLRRQKRYGDRDFRRFLRQYQWACLFFGKQRATEALNRKQAAVWGGPAGWQSARMMSATPMPAAV